MRPADGKALLGAALAFALVALAPSGAHAYCRSTGSTGDLCNAPSSRPQLYWSSRCAGFVVQSEPTMITSSPSLEVDQAFGAWQGRLCGSGDAAQSPSLRLLVFGSQPSLKVEYRVGGTNQNVVVFQKLPGEDIGLAAKTTVTFSMATGEILDTDILIDERSGAIDLPSILTHEAGHALGLAHSLDREATMDPTTEEGEIKKRSLNQDDADGVCAIYPPNGTRPTAAGIIAATPCNLTTAGSSCTPEVSGGCATGGRDAGAGGMGTILVGVIALALRRRRGVVLSPLTKSE
ncbi:MAG: matrixin family metalloprotease [Polyangiaceae bacterium]|nr:matrixin family metalloprotease [Polyangiaceae bacterium]